MVEQFADEYSGFLYLDKDGLPEEALHWVHRFHHAENLLLQQDEGRDES